MSGGGWIGVDLDGTLATYDRWRGPDHVGAPIRRMRRRVVDWRAEGHPELKTRDIRIFTARVNSDDAIRTWCRRHLGEELPITNVKDFGCLRIYDDRARQVVENTGRIVGVDE